MIESINRTYKAKVVRSGDWSRYKVARLGISVGQPYHEGEKFKAAIEWASGRFARHVVVVADTLQRHNLLGGDTPENRRIARAAGDDWLGRNGPIIHTLPNFQIIRWDDLLDDTDYSRYFYEQNGRGMTPYIQEEVAAFLMLQDRTPAADIYPGSFLPIWKELNRPDLSLTRIDFIRRARGSPLGLAA